MKKIYSIVALLAVAFTANAQRQAVTGRSMNPVSASNSSFSVQMSGPTDTITAGLDWTNTANPTMYTVAAPYGGFLVGTNGYLDRQKVQVYDPGTPVTVYGAIYWFGSKTVTTANSIVKMRVYHIDGMGVSTTSATTTTADTPCPNTTYVSDNVPLANVDTSLSLSGAYIHTFSAAQFCAGQFGVGFDVTGVQYANGDTLGLVSSTAGEVSPNINSDYNWEQWDPNNDWHSIASAWTDANQQPLLIELAIFPIVEMNTGVNETPFVNGVKLGFAGPNPTSDNTVVKYDLAKDANNVTLTILDAQGKVVSRETRKNQAAGAYTYDVNGLNLAAGTYFVQLQADNSRLAVKMVKN